MSIRHFACEPLATRHPVKIYQLPIADCAAQQAVVISADFFLNGEVIEMKLCFIISALLVFAPFAHGSSSICQRAVRAYCFPSGKADCSTFFNNELKPYNARKMIPLTIELLKKRRNEIKTLARTYHFDARAFVGTLLSANVKLTPESGRSCGGLSGSNSTTSVGFDSGTRDSRSLNSGALNSGSLDSGLVDDVRGSGMDSGALDSGSLNSGALDSGSLDSGLVDDVRGSGMDSGALDSGSLNSGALNSGSLVIHQKSPRSEVPTCLRNLGRLDHGAEMVAEKFVSQTSGVPPRSEQQVLDALYSSPEDLTFAAALFARNKNIFAAHKLKFDLPIAATLYFLSDIPGKAQRIVSEKRLPRANSFGLYAQCNQDLIDEILDDHK